jgi:Tol biopolymer transport system component
MLADGQRVVVLDGKPGKPCEMVFEGIFAFSPDSRRMAYGARKGNGWFVVVGSLTPAPQGGEGRPTEFGPYEFLGSSMGIQFSRDGSRLAFEGQVNKKWSVILDGKPQPVYDNLGPLVFSPDGKRIAYAAMQKDQERETWQVVAALTPNPSPKRGEGGSWEGKPGAVFDAIGEGTLLFSPDSKHLAYAAQSGGQWCMVLDGKPGRPYEGIAQVKFSPSSQLLAYVAKRQEAEAVITESLVGPALPADGGQRPAKPALPTEGPPRSFGRIGGGTLVFSPGGRHLAYVASSGRGSFVVVDGNRKPRYDMVGYLTFTPDGRYPVYAAIKSKKTFTVVGDKEGTYQYDAIWMPRGEALRFVAPTRFRYLAVKDGNIYAVEEQVE